ncbi:MAG: replication initiator protein A [Blautia faecis]
MSDFAYFQEQDSEQFSFFRIPKILFSDERFRNLSSEAKILYGLMLDRVGLSRKNGWVDAEGNVYIHFTIEEMMSFLNGADTGFFSCLMSWMKRNRESV